MNVAIVIPASRASSSGDSCAPVSLETGRRRCSKPEILGNPFKRPRIAILGLFGLSTQLLSVMSANRKQQLDAGRLPLPGRVLCARGPWKATPVVGERINAFGGSERIISHDGGQPP